MMTINKDRFTGALIVDDPIGPFRACNHEDMIYNQVISDLKETLKLRDIEEKLQNIMIENCTIRATLNDFKLAFECAQETKFTKIAKIFKYKRLLRKINNIRLYLLAHGHRIRNE